MINTEHIATCGINCSLCIAYQRKKNKCSGCNSPNANKAKHCTSCYIKNCEELLKVEDKFCYSCTKFPCKRLKQLDTRYRTKYGMSVIENLEIIKNQGIERFIEKEIKKWTCEKCGYLYCVHREQCQNCGSINEKFPKNEVVSK